MLKSISKLGLAVALMLPMVSGVQAADLSLSIELPKIPVAEYHRPYVSIWVEGEGAKETLAVWYQLDRDGQDWLKDMRQWWRKLGRAQTFPVDGVSGATKAPGVHTVTFSDSDTALKNLKPGKYTLFVEAAREVGGREMLQLSFEWPVASEATAQGKTELGAIALKVTP